MSILWRFAWCIASIVWAGNSVASPVSGAYLNQGDSFVELLQITARSDGSLEGTLMQAELQPNGSVTQTNDAITGSVDGHAITIVTKKPLQTTSLSGTFDGGVLGQRIITLALPNGMARYVESDMNRYQSILNAMKSKGGAIKRRRRIKDEDASVAELNKRLNDYVATVQTTRNTSLLAEFHATHEKALATARRDLVVQRSYPYKSVQASQIAVAIDQAQVGLWSYDVQWEGTVKQGRAHLQDFNTAIAQSPCARSGFRPSNCESAPEAIRAYQVVKLLVERRCAEIMSTIETDHATMDIIARQAHAYTMGRTIDENAARRAVAAISEQRANAASKARREALKDAMRDAALGAADIPNGATDRNHANRDVSDNGYAAKVRACIQPRVAYSVPPRSGSNPTVEYRVTLSQTGMVESVEIRRSSGIPDFDRAVARGIEGCSPFPKPPSLGYPSYIDGNYYMFSD